LTLSKLSSGWTLGTIKTLDSFSDEFRPEILRIAMIAVVILIFISGAGVWTTHSIGRRWQIAEQQIRDAKENLEARVKQRTQELSESESKYRRLIDNLKKYYFFYSHDREGIFTYVSQSITEILGYTQEELFNHYETYFTNELMNKQAHSYTRKSLAGEQQSPYRLSIYHKNGSVRYLDVTEIPLFDENNKVIGVEFG